MSCHACFIKGLLKGVLQLRCTYYAGSCGMVFVLWPQQLAAGPYCSVMEVSELSLQSAARALDNKTRACWRLFGACLHLVCSL
jgi:hypothetical protein